MQNLQERLGKINDLAAAQARLKRWLEQAKGSEQAAYLQEMLSQEQQRLEERRSEFLTWWNVGREAELRQLLTLQPLIPANA
jgi:CHAD domain-containing protein